MNRDLVLAAAWLACLAAFLGLGAYAGSRDAPGIDLDIARAVQDLPEALGPAFDGVNWLGAGWPLTILTLVAAAVFYLRGLGLEALLLVLSFAARGTQALTKEIFEAPRPTPEQLDVSQTVGTFAYPSGHVVATVFVFTLLLVFAARLALPDSATWLLRAFAVAMILTVGVGRVWAGVHWPSDVLGGYLFAALWLIPLLRYEAPLSARLRA